MRAALGSESVAVTLRKPGGLANTTLRMITEASGQTELAVDFSVTIFPSAGLFWYSVAWGRRLMSVSTAISSAFGSTFTAVGECLTIRPVACERATPAMIQ